MIAPMPATPPVLLGAIPYQNRHVDAWGLDVHHGRRRVKLAMLHLVVGLVVSAAVAASAHAESLADLLATVAANARFETPARADVRIECKGGCRAARAIFLGRADALYVEVQGGPRALIRPGAILVGSDGHAADAAPDARLGDTDVLLQDLAVFAPSSLQVPQISDDSPAGVVVTGAPTGRSPYVLLVHTIDREQRVIGKTQYYRGSIGHLAAIRRDAGWVRVGGHWRPGEVAVESLDRDTTTRLTLTWRETPDAPAALFEPAGLERPSGLSWP